MDIKGKIEQKRTAMGDNEMSAKELKSELETKQYVR